MESIKNDLNKLINLTKEVDISVIDKNNKNIFFIILKNYSLTLLEKIYYLPEHKIIEIELNNNKKITIDIDFILQKILNMKNIIPDEYYLLDKQELNNKDKGIWLKLEI